MKAGQSFKYFRFLPFLKLLVALGLTLGVFQTSGAPFSSHRDRSFGHDLQLDVPLIHLPIYLESEAEEDSTSSDGIAFSGNCLLSHSRYFVSFLKPSASIERRVPCYILYHSWKAFLI